EGEAAAAGVRGIAAIGGGDCASAQACRRVGHRASGRTAAACERAARAAECAGPAAAEAGIAGWGCLDSQVDIADGGCTGGSLPRGDYGGRAGDAGRRQTLCGQRRGGRCRGRGPSAGVDGKETERLQSGRVEGKHSRQDDPAASHPEHPWTAPVPLLESLFETPRRGPNNTPCVTLSGLLDNGTFASPGMGASRSVAERRNLNGRQGLPRSPTQRGTPELERLDSA